MCEQVTAAVAAQMNCHHHYVLQKFPLSNLIFYTCAAQKHSNAMHILLNLWTISQPPNWPHTYTIEPLILHYHHQHVPKKDSKIKGSSKLTLPNWCLASSHLYTFSKNKKTKKKAKNDHQGDHQEYRAPQKYECAYSSSAVRASNACNFFLGHQLHLLAVLLCFLLCPAATSVHMQLHHQKHIEQLLHELTPFIVVPVLQSSRVCSINIC